jgi:transcriptional regulatory protein LevR
MEATSGVKGVQELINEGTPIDYLEGDGDNTLISRLKTELNVEVKKRFDKNHVVKNFTKNLYNLKKEKAIKLSKNVICHLEKCLKYAFQKTRVTVLE